MPTLATQTHTKPLIKIKEKGQLTLPMKLRARHGLKIGDYVEVTEEKGRIVLVPQDIVPRDPRVDAILTEALADIRAGRVVPYRDHKQFVRWSATKEGKNFLKQ